MRATSVSGRLRLLKLIEVSRALGLRILVQSLILLTPSMAISTRFLLLLSFLCCLSQTACAETVIDFYQNGPHAVANVTVKREGALCRSLRVVIPEDAGRFPVVQFQHGFELRNTDYSELITQVASWGFIVVAPQMYGLISTDITTEIKNARSILNWMKTGLIASLTKQGFANHQPDFDKVALAGHSRGGLIVFGLALNSGNVSQRYSAIVGLDPVDAKGPGAPAILTHKENSIDVGVPTLIVGTGLGSQKNCWGLLQACAPKNRGHINFYTDLTPASFYFVATKNGHMDFTDDCNATTIARLRCWPICKAGPSPQPMRQFSAGIMVAFLQDVLLHNNASLLAALTKAVRPPVDLDTPKYKGNISCLYEAHQYADM